MKKDLTELVFILDKSGSMSGLESDTIGGFNSMQKKQKEEPGKAIVTTVIFDNNYFLLHDRIDIKGIKPITKKEYFVEGNTALLDAVGKTINRIANTQQHANEEDRAGKVLFVIITDGMENASREYTYKQVKRMVEVQKSEYCWEFIFLGANIDAIETAGRFGIQSDRAVNYHADDIGTQINYDAISAAVSEMRVKRTLSNEWREVIDDDYIKRK